MFRLLDHKGKRVEVALDLHRPRWLIKTHVGPPCSSKKQWVNGKSTDKSRDETKEVALQGCQFYVHQPGRELCLRNGIKRLHAWVIGTIVDPTPIRKQCRSEVIYHYKKYKSFVLAETERPIFSAELAWFSFSDVDNRGYVYVPDPH